MANRSRTTWKTKRGIYIASEFGEVVVSNADTVTMGNLVSTSNPWNVTLVKQSDGTAMTCTYAAGTNVVTITGAGTNIPCQYMNIGVKA